MTARLSVGPPHPSAFPSLGSPGLNWLTAIWQRTGGQAGTTDGLQAMATHLTALGTTQTTAFYIVADANTFTTVASGTGAILPAALSPGDEILIFNRGASTLAVYPSLGAAIESGSVNASVSLSAGGTARFTYESATQWRQG